MTNENNIIISRLNDLLVSVKKGRRFAFSSFLNAEQLSAAYSSVCSGDVEFSVFGGFEDAERCIIGFGCDTAPEPNDFPISIISFSLKNNHSINHRNVLGSLMSLGIKRECVGDIVFKDDKCYIFADNKITDFLLFNFTFFSIFILCMI